MSDNWREMETGEESALAFIFPTKDKFKQLQMLTELRPKEVVPISVVGMFRRMYKSQVLKVFEEEIFLNRKSLDRKGVLEASEIISARRKSLGDDKGEAGLGL